MRSSDEDRHVNRRRRLPGIERGDPRRGAQGLFHYQDEFVGFLEGWRGLLEDKTMPLDLAAVGGILPRGGTILRTSRTNPAKQADGLQTLHGHAEEAQDATP